MHATMKNLHKSNNLCKGTIEVILAPIGTRISHLCYIFGLLKITKST
jgi:hypothetical protein